MALAWSRLARHVVDGTSTAQHSQGRLLVPEEPWSTGPCHSTLKQEPDALLGGVGEGHAAMFGNKDDGDALVDAWCRRRPDAMQQTITAAPGDAARGGVSRRGEAARGRQEAAGRDKARGRADRDNRTHRHDHEAMTDQEAATTVVETVRGAAGRCGLRASTLEDEAVVQRMKRQGAPRGQRPPPAVEGPFRAVRIVEAASSSAHAGSTTLARRPSLRAQDDDRSAAPHGAHAVERAHSAG